MAANFGNAWTAPATQRDLMKYQTVHADPRIRMDDDPVRVRDQQTAANLARQRDVSARDNRPEPVWQHEQLAITGRDKTGLLPPGLVFADRTQELSSGIPELTWFLPAPIGNLCTDRFQELIRPGSSFLPFGVAQSAPCWKATSIWSNLFQWRCNPIACMVTHLPREAGEVPN